MTMHRTMRPPSMSDVAQLAGVSHQTVSRVLNGTGKVAPDTRERILAAIAKLGYRRNSVARALASKRSGILGVIASTSVRFGPASMLVNVEVAARDAGYFTGVTVIDDFGAEALASAIDHFLGLAVEAIVVIAPVVGLAEALDAVHVPVPLVVVSAVGDEQALRVQSVRIDQRGGAASAVRHLLGLGHRDVLHLAGPSDWYEGRARLAGWRQEMEAAGLETREPIGFGWDAATGYEAMRPLLASGDAPTAVFAANDALALGAYKAIFEAGMSVPGDVSVVGFDDAPSSAFYPPALTTVRQDFASLGALAISTVRGAVVDPAAVVPVVVPTSLVVRDSTAAPRA